jgi:type I restriction enzyme S subunit
MKLETFFEKFDQFADVPDAVAKMRELVLQLAVTGKLVAHDNRDEPASSLLESTAAERAKLVAAKKIKSRPTAPVEPDEQPFDVPSNWAWARLSDVGYELGQKVPDKRFTYIDVGGIDSDKGRISDRVEQLEPGDAPSRARKLVARGTVIYSTVRPYLLNIAIVDQDFDPEPIASTAFGILHPFTGINNRYLFYWLRSTPFTDYVQAGMKGMAYPAINDEKFYSGPIGLPPLAEQTRIVAKVDELMVLCDRLEAQQQELETWHAALARASLARFADAPSPANLNFLFHPSYTISPADLRKSILTLAVQGKLVPQETKPKVGSLDSVLAEASVNGVSKGPTSDKSATEILRISAGTSRGDFYVNEDDFKHVDLPPNEIEKFQLAPGDLLACRFNGNLHYVGRFSYYRGESGRVQVNPDKLIRFRINTESYCPRYICLAMNAAPTREAIEAMCATTAGNIGLSAGRLKTVKIPLPSLAEQRRIVAKVEQLMALVDALEMQLAASHATAANLLNALVAELTAPKRGDDET